MIMEVLVGRKGEIYTPKSLRESLGLKPGDRLIVEVRGNQMVLRKPPSMDKILVKKPKVEIGLDEDLRLRGEISRRLEGAAST